MLSVPMQKRSVAIVGAGAAGLCAARHLIAGPDRHLFDCSVFEATGQVSGTWVFTDQTGSDSYGVPIFSSMYKHLRTNLPKEIMAFPDFPFTSKFGDGDNSFVHHTTVDAYLREYSEHFGISPAIEFYTLVTHIEPHEATSQDTAWWVESRNVKSGKTNRRRFDYVIICSGHFSVPRIPKEFENVQEQFKGRVLHSHTYREPDSFRNSRVVILGAGPSGQDIALEIAHIAQMVYLSHNQPDLLKSKLPDNLKQVAGIAGFLPPNKVQFRDGTEVQADAIIFCTGYQNNYPFLDKSCGIVIEDNVVKPLYQHLVNINQPTMTFIGIPTQVLPFPLFHLQVKWWISVILGRKKLPSCEEMRHHTEMDLKKRIEIGWKKSHAHKFMYFFKDYMLNDLGFTNEEEPWINPYIEIHYRMHFLRQTDLQNYKQYKCVLGPDGKVQIFNPHSGNSSL